MFESVVSQITNVVRNVANTFTSIIRRSPWLAILAVAVVAVLSWG